MVKRKMDGKYEMSVVVRKNQNVIYDNQRNVEVDASVKQLMQDIKILQEDVNNYLTELVEKDKKESSTPESPFTSTDDEDDNDSEDIINLKRKIVLPSKENKKNKQ